MFMRVQFPVQGHSSEGPEHSGSALEHILNWLTGQYIYTQVLIKGLLAEISCKHTKAKTL